MSDLTLTPEAANIIILAGKDYFTEEEAAFYSCVSLSQFRNLRVLA